MLKKLIAHETRTRTIALPRGRIGLHAVPTAVGIEHQTHPGYSWDGRKRGATPFVVIQHTLAGQGQLDYEGRRLAIGPGTTMLVRIPHEHRYFLAPGDQWHFFFLVLTGREVLYLAEEILRTSGPALTLGGDAAGRLGEICLSLLDTPAHSPGEASARAYEAVTILFDHAAVSTVDGGNWAAPVLAHIARHLDAPLPVEALAEVAGMSRAHFVRQFTRLMGSAPSEHIFRLRMEKAAHLLESSSATIVEIADQCGFRNPNYFAKAFRRAFDVSPTEFRDSGMYSMPDWPTRAPAAISA